MDGFAGYHSPRLRLSLQLGPSWIRSMSCIWLRTS